jgi:hypothetical protein
MLLRPWLLYYRRRLLIAAGIALAGALFTLFATSADQVNGFRVLWHTPCVCPPDTGDLTAIFATFASVAFLIGYILGIGMEITTTGATASRGNTPYFFSRPITRASVLFVPLALAAVAVVTLPILATLLLLGWLNLVRAPALAHLLAVMQQIPAVASLGPHPSLFSFLGAIAFLPRVLAALSIGLCTYALLASQRWFSLSSNPWVKFLGTMMMTFPVLFFPIMKMFDTHFLSRLLLMPGASNPFYVPSIPDIALHFVFAAAILFSCFRLNQRADL